MRKRMRASRSVPAGGIAGIQPSCHMNSKPPTISTCLNVLEPNARSKRQLLFTPAPNKRVKKSPRHVSNLSLRLIDRELPGFACGVEKLESSTPTLSRNLFNEAARNSLSSCDSLPSLASPDSAASAPELFHSPSPLTQFSSTRRRFSTPRAGRRVPSAPPHPLSDCPSTSPIARGHTPPRRLSSPSKERRNCASSLSSSSHPRFMVSPGEPFRDVSFATSSTSFYSHPHPYASPMSALWRCGDYSSYAGAFIGGSSLPRDNPGGELRFPTPLSVPLAPRVTQRNHIPQHLLFSEADLPAVEPAAHIASLFNVLQSTTETPEEDKENNVSMTPPREMKSDTRVPLGEIDLNAPIREICSNTNHDAMERFGENDGAGGAIQVNERSREALSAEREPIAEQASQHTQEDALSGGCDLTDASPSQVFSVGLSSNSSGTRRSSHTYDGIDTPLTHRAQ